MMQDAVQFITNWQIDLGIKPFIAKQYHLSETALAHQDLESGAIIGNIIIECQD
jgi:NADPH:quinone reductase-like Zn-dependent oxidoreductase